MQKQPSKGFVKKGAMRNFAKLTRKHPCRNLIFDKIDQNFVDLQLIKKRRCFLVNFGKFVRTLTLQRIARTLLLITAVSIGKGELVNKTINYDTKTKAQGPTESDQFSSPAERTGFRNSHSQLFFKLGVLKNFANSTGKHLRSRIFLICCRP